MRSTGLLPYARRSLQLARKYFRLRQLSRTVCAALLIFGLLAALFFAANPRLHEMLHHDATHTSHQCAVGIFEHQQLSASNPDIVIVELKPGLALPACVSETIDFSDFNYRFSASRAPPLSLFPAVG